ncbi:MAG: asparagine synthetase B [Candidatus Handelsmanbacteria bacterium RIFCSPLOWO2_12_FULL_64_10]|uniref:Asparagine synthetase B n=1 Tax=Handelsmanbacteria sp. (strain RIFCSPLOWO2_12_FULL_64_10) TaxID=1817868 RepID=A0A1F6CAS1_HANXR|nr:MAG: asparagine synthetase B [Candidatus Handelsmanbacteria bacterium RIFCSPLOWO2_12_FULL_64_10]
MFRSGFLRLNVVVALTLCAAGGAFADKLLIYMDQDQADHLKAYGIAFFVLTKGVDVDWLLNYRGGSFMMDYAEEIAQEARLRGVAGVRIRESEAAQVLAEMADRNMDAVRLEKAPKIAVYTPPDKRPWDDAVTLAMTYAEIPYDTVWDEEVLTGKLSNYDWIHLHHEDFTGQYGKFYASYGQQLWYRQQQAQYEAIARKLGFRKVSEEKRAVAQAIRDYMLNGGFMFAMCSATDTFDLALASEGTDIVDAIYDGDPPDPRCQERLDFSRGVAFEGFKLVMDPLEYEYSDIDVSPRSATQVRTPETDFFTLFEFSAKYDPVPTMLTQDHTAVVKGFLGQTTAFNRGTLKPSVTVLGEVEGTEEVKYIHGNVGKGTFTFYGGHDPEDYQHLVGDPPTDLALHKNSPGYRLILNNVLFPAAKKQKRKT